MLSHLCLVLDAEEAEDVPQLLRRQLLQRCATTAAHISPLRLRCTHCQITCVGHKKRHLCDCIFLKQAYMSLLGWLSMLFGYSSVHVALPC